MNELKDLHVHRPGANIIECCELSLRPIEVLDWIPRILFIRLVLPDEWVSPAGLRMQGGKQVLLYGFYEAWLIVFARKPSSSGFWFVCISQECKYLSTGSTFFCSSRSSCSSCSFCSFTYSRYRPWFLRAPSERFLFSGNLTSQRRD